jgi:hypothetical protein
MKKIATLAIVCLAFASCKKESNKPADANNYFAFGFYFGYCGPTCSEMYKISDGEVYKDSVAISFPTPVIYSAIPLGNTEYQLAQPLQDSFPAYLQARPGITIGCPDCLDQGTVYIEKATNGLVQHWVIDMDDSVLPVEIRNYITSLQAVVGQL